MAIKMRVKALAIFHAHNISHWNISKLAVSVLAKIRLNGVEDEIHVFVQCQRYNDLRVPFFHKLSMLLNDFENQCENQKFILAMSSTDPEVIKMVGKFVNATFSLRECI